MVNSLERPFVSVHSRSALEREIEMAETIMEHENTAHPDATFEEGYIAGINFVLNRYSSNVRDEFEAIMDQSKDCSTPSSTFLSVEQVINRKGTQF